MIDYPNSFFRVNDPHPESLDDFDIPEGWWSRRYEYAWAIERIERNHIAADMGAGWHYRPFHDALEKRCAWVYGVDHHKEILDLPPMKNGSFVVADFSKPIEEIKPESLDRIFCISVLEELINYQEALSEFKRLLKPDGRIIITCDVPYKDDKPAHDKYKGVKLDDLERAILGAGLIYTGSVNRVKYDDLLHNDGFNLCVWHCMLKKINHE